MDNLAIQAQYLGLLALVEDQIVDCFRHGGGVPYSAFPKFQALMAEDSGRRGEVGAVAVTVGRRSIAVEWVRLGLPGWPGSGRPGG
jgi:hypothetical protein